MSYNLKTARWIIYRRRSGKVEVGPIAAIVVGIDGDDPIVAIASPRADFDAALTEWLIGLLSSALSPRDETEWLTRWKTPPSEAELQAALDALSDAFDLDGDGPRFMQDFSASELARQPLEPIQNLLLNAKNGGLFIKPGVVNAMGRPAAAMALLAMQTYSTAGGRGWRTSVRGGGPLTTLVDPRMPLASEVPLWHLLWANVETQAQLESKDRRGGREAPADIFPWLAATRTSANNEATTLDDVHGLQAYFGMPRRIRLVFSDVPGTCDITGQVDECVATGLHGKAYGINYVRWLHPLSPYYEGKSTNEKLPVHPQPGGISWRDWLTLLHDQPDRGTQPAATVTHFRTHRAPKIGLRGYSVRAFGYDASNAKLRVWMSSTLPEFIATDEGRQASIVDGMRGMVEATEVAAFALKAALANALYERGEEVKGDPTNARAMLWEGTESAAYESVKRLAATEDVDAIRRDLSERFRKTLAQTATRLFDEYGPAGSTDPDVLRRLIRARWSLVTTLAGHGKLGEKIFRSLDLPSVAGRAKAPAEKSAKSKKKSGATS